jgi:GDP-D-mannose dehydratase
LIRAITGPKEKLRWSPEVTFEELVKIMVEADWKLARQEKAMGEMED